jgi:SAM-dependent methyltransferase
MVEFIKVKDGEVVYDLGSGDGRVLFALYEKYKNGQFVGIERDYFAYFLSKFRKRKYGNNINFYRADFFSKNMSSVDVVFLYLFPAVLNALLPKFEKELKKVLLFILLIFNLKTENQMK